MIVGQSSMGIVMGVWLSRSTLPKCVRARAHVIEVINGGAALPNDPSVIGPQERLGLCPTVSPFRGDSLLSSIA